MHTQVGSPEAGASTSSCRGGNQGQVGVGSDMPGSTRQEARLPSVTFPSLQQVLVLPLPSPHPASPSTQSSAHDQLSHC